ncbi:MAG: DUF2029 domain-containing protein, partial [Anaerolineae bacterium]|nr:DUF2029 domain-containing protein [Anaerolineae bacterium]
MRPSLSRWLLWLLVACLFLALVAGQSWATYYLFTSRFPGGNDFYSRWANGCALIWTGENPYSDEVTLRTQIGMYGRPARIGEDLAAYSYPLYALFFFWPLCFIHTYPLVQAIWMTLMLYALLAGVVLTARVARWRPPSWLWGATLVWAVFNYPHARALILGQMATLVFLALAAAMWALGRERDVLAGALLAVTTIKPQMSFLLVPWVLWWVAWRRRWGVWKGFGLAMALLVGISFLLVPTWLGDFLEALRYYDVVSATDYHSLTWVMVRYFLGLGPVVEAVGVAAFALYGLLEAWRGRRAGWSGFLWTTGLLLILTHFIAPRTATTHYTTILLSLFSWFALLGERLGLPVGRHGQRAGLVVAGIEVALLVGQWVIFLTTIQG